MKKITDFQKFLKTNPEKTPKPILESQDEINGEKGDVLKNDSYYFSIVNPDTGKKYDIPMLSSIDPAYYFKYIYYMKLRETSPDAFEKVLRWD